ncbi:hypothetical protein FQR65_LT12006 [Abscondita terminalis]|nr:hypothetical protein FQR65_LT12006 [Abscondita terminalis]
MGAKISKRGSGKLRKKSKSEKIERHTSIINLSKAQIYEDLLDEAIRKQYDYDDDEISSPPEKEVEVILRTKSKESDAPNTHPSLIQQSSTNTIYYDISEDNDSFYDAVEMESVNGEKENVEKSTVSKMRFTGPNRKVWTIVSLGNKLKEEGDDVRLFERTNSDPSLIKTTEHDSLQYQKTYTSDAVLLRKEEENWDWDNSRVDTSFDFAVFDQILSRHRNSVNHSYSFSNYDVRKVASSESSQSSDSNSSELETSEEEDDMFEDAHLTVDVTDEFEKVNINDEYIHRINDYSIVNKTDFQTNSSSLLDNVVYRQHATTIPLRKSATLSSLEKIEELQEEAYGANNTFAYDPDKTDQTELTAEHKRKSSLNLLVAIKNEEVESSNSHSSSKSYQYSSTSSDISEQDDKSVKKDVFEHPIENFSMHKQKEKLTRPSSYPELNQKRNSLTSSNLSEDNYAHVKTNNDYLLNSSMSLSKYEELDVINPVKHEYEFLKSHDSSGLEECKDTEFQVNSHITNFQENRYPSSISSSSSESNNENQFTIDELKNIIKTINVLEKQIKNEKNSIDNTSTYQKLIKIMMQFKKMGVKSSKQSYNVEQVGQNVKSKDSLRKKEAEEKHLPVSNDMVIEEIISAVQKTEQAPTPRLSKEEQLKEEELIIAKVRGDIVPRLEDSSKIDVKEDVKPNNVNDLDAITVIKEEISESVPIVTLQNIVEAEKARTIEAKRVSIKEDHEEINNDLSNEIEKFETLQNIVEAEKARTIETKRVSIKEDHEEINNDLSNEIEKFESSKIEEINTIVCTNEIFDKSNEEQTRLDVTNTEEMVEETLTTQVEEQKESLDIERVDKKTEEIAEAIACDHINETICTNTTEENQESTNLLAVEQIENYESKSNGFLEIKELSIIEHKYEEETHKIEEQSEIKNELICTTATTDKSDENKEATCKTLEHQNGIPQFEKLETSIVNTTKEEKMESTPKQVFLQEISDVEKLVNGLKEKILHFTGTAQDKEFSVLHEELIKHIIKLDDISFEDDEVMNERRRVIKMIQRCVQNLERKLEQSDDDHHTTDSE